MSNNTDSQCASEKHLIISFKEATQYSNAYSIVGQCAGMKDLNFATKVMMVHQLLAKLDKDWPYPLYEGASTTIASDIKDVDIPPDVCPKCGGLVYLNPVLTYNIIKEVAKAVELDISTCMLLDADICEEGAKWVENFKAGNGLDIADSPALHLSPFGSFTTPERISQLVKDSLSSIAGGKPHSETAEPLKFYNLHTSDYANVEDTKTRINERKQKDYKPTHIYAGAR